MGRKKGKLSKGQPAGSRSASGRKRDRTPQRVAPCDGVQRRHDLYRVATAGASKRDQKVTDTCDPLGRAYNAGLLGPEEVASRRLNAGRLLARRYWRIFPDMTPADSLARFHPQREPGEPISSEERLEREKASEAALNEALAAILQRGRPVRRAFDQLVIDFAPDFGPAWLDRIVYAHRRKQEAAAGDLAMLERAIDGLDAIC